MLVNIFTWLALAAIAVLFGWLAVRAWRSRRWYVKWPGMILSSLLSLVLLLVCAVALKGLVKLYTPQGSPVQITVEGTPEQVQRGQYLANVFCVSCHSKTGELPLAGGVDMAKDIPLPIGSMIPANLTPAGPLQNWTDSEIFRVLRQSVDRQGRVLPTMSTVRARFMSDEDIKAIIAYLRSQPAVDNPTPNPPSRLNFLGALVTGLSMVPELPVVTGEVIAPPKEATAKYGEYLTNFQDCKVCHGPQLTGGTNTLTPNGPTLRMVKGWTQEQFIATFRTGVNPDGRQLIALMPWKMVARLDDTDLAAIYQYLASLK